MLKWMMWTTGSALVVVCLVSMLAMLLVWDQLDRSLEREEGFIPMETSRGDRVFIGLISMIIIGLCWLRFLGNKNMVGALVVSVVWMFVLVKFG